MTARLQTSSGADATVSVMVAFNEIHPFFMLAGGAAAGVVVGLVVHLFRQARLKRRK